MSDFMIYTKEYKGLAFVNMKGLTVEQDNAIRTAVRTAEGRLSIYRALDVANEIGSTEYAYMRDCIGIYNAIVYFNNEEMLDQLKQLDIDTEGQVVGKVCFNGKKVDLKKHISTTKVERVLGNDLRIYGYTKERSLVLRAIREIANVSLTEAFAIVRKCDEPNGAFIKSFFDEEEYQKARALLEEAGGITVKMSEEEKARIEAEKEARKQQKIVDDYKQAVMEVAKSLYKAKTERLAQAEDEADLLYLQGMEAYSEKDYSQAADLFNEAVEMGSDKALHGLSVLYYFGYGVEKDIVKSVELDKKGAELGCANCLNGMAINYKNGICVEKDEKKYVELLKKAAELGDQNALRNLANVYLAGNLVPQSDEEYFRLLESSARKGSGIASKKLGDHYYYGNGLKENRTVANYWYKLAACQGYANAMYDIGHAYYFGDYEDQKPALGVAWYQQGASRGNLDCQYYYALALWQGEYVPMDQNEAVRLIKDAADKGHASSCSYMGRYYYEGDKQIVELIDDKQAEAYLQTAVDCGNKNAVEFVEKRKEEQEKELARQKQLEAERLERERKERELYSLFPGKETRKELWDGISNLYSAWRRYMHDSLRCAFDEDTIRYLTWKTQGFIDMDLPIKYAEEKGISVNRFLPSYSHMRDYLNELAEAEQFFTDILKKEPNDAAARYLFLLAKLGIPDLDHLPNAFGNPLDMPEYAAVLKCKDKEIVEHVKKYVSSNTDSWKQLMKKHKDGLLAELRNAKASLEASKKYDLSDEISYDNQHIAWLNKVLAQMKSI